MCQICQLYSLSHYIMILESDVPNSCALTGLNWKFAYSECCSECEMHRHVGYMGKAAIPALCTLVHPSFLPSERCPPNDAKSSMLNWTSELCYWSWNHVSIGPKGNFSRVAPGWVKGEEAQKVLEWVGGRKREEPVNVVTALQDVNS